MDILLDLLTPRCQLITLSYKCIVRVSQLFAFFISNLKYLFLNILDRLFNRWFKESTFLRVTVAQSISTGDNKC